MEIEERDIWVIIFVVFSFLFGVAIGLNDGYDISVTKIYTLEDGTVLYDCTTHSLDCGWTLKYCHNINDVYVCQKNVKITTETKNKCGAN